MSWVCAQFEEHLSDHLEGALKAEEQREFFAHAATCANCAQLVRQVAGMVQGMKSLEAVEPPPDLVPRILASTLETRHAARPDSRPLGWLSLLWQPRFGAGALSLATAAAMLLYAAGAFPGLPNRTPWRPADLFHSVNRSAHLTYARGEKYFNDLRVVYEIESQLRPEEQPVPQANPAAEPPAPEKANPEQKSLRKPRSGSKAGGGLPSLALLQNESFGRKT